MNIQPNRKTIIHFSLLFKITALVFFCLLGVFILIFFMLVLHGKIQSEWFVDQVPFLPFLFSSIIIGTVLSSLAARVMFKPYTELIKAIKQIASGNFNVSLDSRIRGPEEIISLFNSFNTMAAELRNMEIMHSDFIRNVSHEYKTPVSSIRGFAKMLKEDCESQFLNDDERKEYIDLILQESGRLSSMTGNVLLLSKVDNEEILTDKTDFSLDEQIRQIAASLEVQLEKKEISLEAVMDTAIINGNEDLLSHVWLNILGNSIKFTPSGGSISISLVDDGKKIVTITDTGYGMNDETKAHMFDKFYQGDTSHATEGNGLGMALVKRIVELHGGTVGVKSELGKGTKVTVELV